MAAQSTLQNRKSSQMLIRVISSSPCCLQRLMVHFIKQQNEQGPLGLREVATGKSKHTDLTCQVWRSPRSPVAVAQGTNNGFGQLELGFISATKGTAKTLSSPASIAGDDAKRSLGRTTGETERATPAHSDPTDEHCTSGQAGRGSQLNRKRRRKETPICILHSTGGASAGGACDHCGRRNSPAWRRGPADKPHLCNACGVRFLGKGTLEGYMPGMKQREDFKLPDDNLCGALDEEGGDDTDSAKTTMPQLSGKTRCRSQRTPRRNTTPRSDMVSGPPAVADAESDDGRAASCYSCWADCVRMALSHHPGNARKVVSFLENACGLAMAEPLSSPHFLAELNRVRDLYWMDKNRAMDALKHLLEDEAALTLSGAEALLTLSGASPMPDDRKRDALCSTEDVNSRDSSWAVCEECGRARETVCWLPVWWRYLCGDQDYSKNPELTCKDVGDFVAPRGLPRSEVSPVIRRGIRGQGPQNRFLPASVGRSNARRTSGVADMSTEGFKVVDNPVYDGYGSPKSPRHKPFTGLRSSFTDSLSASDFEFLRWLPQGWRMDFGWQRLGEPGRVSPAGLNYFAPDGSGPYQSQEDVLARIAAQPSFRPPQPGATAATFTPGPAFHRSPSGSVLVSMCGGAVSTTGEAPPGAIHKDTPMVQAEMQSYILQAETPITEAPHLARSEVSLTHLPSAAGEPSSEPSPLSAKEPAKGGPRSKKARTKRSGPSHPRQRQAKTFEVDGDFCFGVRELVPNTFELGGWPRDLQQSINVVYKPAKAAIDGTVPDAALRGQGKMTPPQGLLQKEGMRELEPAQAHAGSNDKGRATQTTLVKHKSEPVGKLHGQALTELHGPPSLLPPPRLLPPARPALGMTDELVFCPVEGPPLIVATPEGGSVANPRGLLRAVSDPSSAAKAYAANALEQAGASPEPHDLKEVDWKGVLKVSVGGTEPDEICALVAKLPASDAEQLPSTLLISSFKPRAEIFMANVGSKPVLLRLATCAEASKKIIRKMEEDKLAAIAHLKAFDFALIPHTNQKNGLHIVGLKLLSKEFSGSTS
eukprot:jgi/Botrbrau1/15708/Bobra.4_1s0081.2